MGAFIDELNGPFMHLNESASPMNSTSGSTMGTSPASWLTAANLPNVYTWIHSAAPLPPGLLMLLQAMGTRHLENLQPAAWNLSNSSSSPSIVNSLGELGNGLDLSFARIPGMIYDASLSDVGRRIIKHCL
ncbi:hypothetical protein APHAL10511_008281 [Amanita phalloides]|nr:hypothetical protein APHAL10511_008281 [Amanita phalloides]